MAFAAIDSAPTHPNTQSKCSLCGRHGHVEADCRRGGRDRDRHAAQRYGHGEADCQNWGRDRDRHAAQRPLKSDFGCWDFKKGVCEPGDKCRFSHVIEDDIEDDAARATRLFAEATTLRAKALKTPEPSMAGVARDTSIDLDDRARYLAQEE